MILPSLLLCLALLPADWSVEDGNGPARRLDQTFSEGTWISVDVSPDGEHLVFDLLGHLYEMPVAGGRAEALTDGRSWNMFPRYSPDGASIAFTSDRGGSNDLWVMARGGGRPRNVSKQSLPVFQGTWSADGRALYGTTLDMKVSFPAHRYGLLGGRQEIMGADGRAPLQGFQENPADGRLYYVHQDESLPRSGPRIKTHDLETGEGRIVVDRPGGGAAGRLSPDGRLLAYVHRDDQLTTLVLRDLVTGTDRTLRTDLDRGRFDSRSFYGAYSNLAWMPDGSALVLSWGGGLHRVDATTGDATSIPFEAEVGRELDATMRFPVELPEQGAEITRSARWPRRASDGVVFETLGDLWFTGGGARDVPAPLTRTPEHETCPLPLPGGELLAWCTWSDVDLGGVRLGSLVDGAVEGALDLPGPPSQYGSLSACRAPGGEGYWLAALRGSDDMRRGRRLEDQIRYELVLWELPADPWSQPLPEPRLVTDVVWTGNRYAQRPPTILLEPDRGSVLYTHFADDQLVLSRVGVDGREERRLMTFAHATRAVVSPDRQWVAYREYHRSWLTPFEPIGIETTASAHDGDGLALRVDAEDGDFMTWSEDGRTLGWARGPWFVEKTLPEILEADALGQDRTSLRVEYEIDVPAHVVALTGVKVLTMDDAGTELDGVTVLVRGQRIEAVGADVAIPEGATVLPLDGHVIMPGMVDAHGHYGSPISTLNVIEQRPYGLAANLAYGVTTMIDVYGTTQKDFWLDDMVRAGKVDGPRILSVGDPIFVTTYRTKMYRPIADDHDAREHARFNKAHGATALKDYSNHGRQARQHLAEAARAEGLNLVTESFGDVQMNLTQLIDGFTGIEHTMGLEDLYADVLALFAVTDVGMTPTLIVVYNGPAGETWFHQRERVWEDEKLLRFFTAEQLIRYRRPTRYFDDDYNIERMGTALRKLADAGVILTMGAHGQMMGLGAHWETELFVLGGFTEREALRIATINGARHHGLDAQIGSIEPGKLADLIVLSADPTIDIRNTRAVELVLKNGVVHDGDTGARLFPEASAPGAMYTHQGR